MYKDEVMAALLTIPKNCMLDAVLLVTTLSQANMAELDEMHQFTFVPLVIVRCIPKA